MPRSKVKGKTRNDWTHCTMVDFGNRVDILTRHFSEAAALRAYPKWWKIYTKLHGHRIWVETRKEWMTS